MKTLKLHPYQEKILEAFKDGEKFTFAPKNSKKIDSKLVRGKRLRGVTSDFIYIDDFSPPLPENKNIKDTEIYFKDRFQNLKGEKL